MPKFGRISFPRLYSSSILTSHPTFSPLKCQEGIFLLVWHDVAWLVVIADTRSLLSVYNVGFCQTIGFRRVFKHWRVKGKGRYGAIYLNYLYYLPMGKSTVGTWLYTVFIVLLFYLESKPSILVCSSEKAKFSSEKQTNKTTLPK